LIAELLPLYKRLPEPKSVLVIDNASFYYSEQIKQMYNKAKVKLVYLLSYLPNLNLIEEFFAKLKAFIKRNWQNFEQDPKQGFDAFLE
jgi:transposase